MLALNLPQKTSAPLKLLCLGSHSDDIEIGCGGTILRLLSDFNELDIVWTVFGASSEREREARKSAALLLSQARRKEVIVKNFRDGFFPFESTEIRNYFEELKGTSPI